MDDGCKRPIAHASRTLSSSERDYTQIERKALAIVFGVEKFHQFLYERRFIVGDFQSKICYPHTSSSMDAEVGFARWLIRDTLIFSLQVTNLQSRLITCNRKL